MDKIVFFEDERALNFSPISLFRPVFELLCGHHSVRERITRSFPDSSWGGIIRPELQEIYQEEHPEASINTDISIQGGQTLLINGRWLTHKTDLATIQEGTAGWIGDELVWLTVKENDGIELSCPDEVESLRSLAQTKTRVQSTGRLVQYPWDLVSYNGEQLTLDFNDRSKDESLNISHNPGLVGDASNVFIHPSAELDPFVVLDSRHGPIWIDEKAKIQAFTRIEGPAYIGRETQTFRANIREGTSIGPVCRVGGEIEESIIHGFANKYHDGFLGHSYVSPWVNLGALTTNSDLKNDYSNVSVPLAGKGIKSNSNKVGCFIGDHTKTALCSLFNTGSSIGAMSLILPGGELLPKHIPSFSRIWHGKLEELPDGTSSAITTAEYAMGRRGQSFTPAMKRHILSLFEKTQAERELALSRYQ